MTFIEKIVKEVLAKKIENHRLTFVLPTKRACVFLETTLVSELGEASFIPRTLTIEEFMQELASLESIDHVTLLFECYHAYLKQTPENKQVAFDVFCQWGAVVLSDFNMIDSHLVDAQTLFSNLSDVKRLNEWFENEEPTKLSIDYLQFFDNMQDLYHALTQQLLDSKRGYNGLIQRVACDKLDNYLSENKEDKFIFAGFNALSKAEEQIFQQVLAANRAEVYWDACEEIMKNQHHAGKYLRAYRNTWEFYQKNEFKWINTEKKTDIELIGAPKNVSQFKHVGALLKKIDAQKNTALVLGDENLLPLAINSIPEEISNINITMGLPLQQMPLSNLFENLFRLHLNQQKFGKSDSHEFYYKDIIMLLDHPFLRFHFGTIFLKMVEYIKENNLNFIAVSSLQSMLNTDEKKAIEPVFKMLYNAKDVDRFIQNCKDLLLFLKADFEGVELEQLFLIHQVFEKLDQLQQKYGYLTNVKSLQAVYNSLLKQSKLTFKGAPLEGFQVMGLLETRAIEFGTLILTSVNEGVIPQKSNPHSFIPFDLKKYYGLPTQHDQINIFAYHFYRLIHGANKVFLTYNSETDSFGSGEKSRFITQLQINGKIKSEYLLSPNLQIQQPQKQCIEKTPETMKKLEELCHHGLTPSSISTYISNPILFYERYVMRLEELEEVEETIAERTMGTVIHEVLHNLYRPFVSKKLNAEDLKEMQTLVEPLLMNEFSKHFNKESLQTGRNKLIFEVCKANIHRFLKHELTLINQRKNLKIIGLEQTIKVAVSLTGVNHQIFFRGIIDRIDEFENQARIVDYKTGKVIASDLKFADFEKLKETKYQKALQLMMYGYLFSKSNGDAQHQDFAAGIFSFKSLNNGFLPINFNEKRGQPDTLMTKERVDEFEKFLFEIIQELLNPEVDFVEA